MGVDTAWFKSRGHTQSVCITGPDWRIHTSSTLTINHQSIFQGSILGSDMASLTPLRFTNWNNLRRAACGVTPFSTPRNGDGNPQNGVGYSILFQDPLCSTKDDELNRVYCQFIDSFLAKKAGSQILFNLNSDARFVILSSFSIS